MYVNVCTGKYVFSFVSFTKLIYNIMGVLLHVSVSPSAVCVSVCVQCVCVVVFLALETDRSHFKTKLLVALPKV